MKFKKLQKKNIFINLQTRCKRVFKYNGDYLNV